MSYALKIIKDHPIMFLPLDETSGSVAYDISGCGNNGTHSDGIVSGLMPLIPGGTTGTTITNTKYVDCSIDNNYFAEQADPGFGKSGFTDKPFSFEILIYPKFNTSENLIFGDQVNDVGISWDNGNIMFKLGSELIEYTVPDYNKVLHIVCTYNVSYAYIYIDGVAVAGKELTDFAFTNTYLNVSVGPTAGSNSYFIVDAPAIYRYALSPEQILNHYNATQEQMLPIHIVSPDNGVLFRASEENSKEVSFISYPTLRSFYDLVVDGLSYDKIFNSIYLTPTDAAEEVEVSINDYMLVPMQDSIIRSKISWIGSDGISVFTSTDGETYSECTNGGQVPGYIDGIDEGSGILYFRVTFSSLDASRFNPELRFLNISFYSTDKIYSFNNNEYIEKISGSYLNVGNNNYPVLSRNIKNGITLAAGNGFKINTPSEVKTIEMFYTPSVLTKSAIIYGPNVAYTWSNTGSITKGGISSFYVNGVNKYSSTSISNVFIAGETYHIVMVLDETLTGDIEFNYYTGQDSWGGGRYQNIAFYQSELSESEIQEHYNLYIGRALAQVSDTSISVTESAVSVVNNDWVVIKSV